MPATSLGALSSSALSSPRTGRIPQGRITRLIWPCRHSTVSAQEWGRGGFILSPLPDPREGDKQEALGNDLDPLYNTGKKTVCVDRVRADTEANRGDGWSGNFYIYGLVDCQEFLERSKGTPDKLLQWGFLLEKMRLCRYSGSPNYGVKCLELIMEWLVQKNSKG